jgi:hypothetical protein
MVDHPVRTSESRSREAKETSKSKVTSNIAPLMERNEAFAASGTWRNTPRLPFLPFNPHFSRG